MFVISFLLSLSLDNSTETDSRVIIPNGLFLHSFPRAFRVTFNNAIVGAERTKENGVSRGRRITFTSEIEASRGVTQMNLHEADINLRVLGWSEGLLDNRLRQRTAPLPRRILGSRLPGVLLRASTKGASSPSNHQGLILLPILSLCLARHQ
ncbi:hypothetical protein PGTUg99_015040 [Puccinia graminis f. sp. tritici]|uniref:Uncharacterized protein n=1 Tax=Puccinia graminis f. sp. tritici TaxID=56615 RepID=A0A5B0S1Q4_PUCGR|nr:hypothetical protein PGTUg99_015040 [Puccinia graminis f. sp. tritici]